MPTVAAPSSRAVVLALYRSIMRSAKQLEQHSSRALSEHELHEQLQTLQLHWLRERGSGLLLSQLVRTDFQSNKSETRPERVGEALDRAFCALRKIDALVRAVDADKAGAAPAKRKAAYGAVRERAR